MSVRIDFQGLVSTAKDSFSKTKFVGNRNITGHFIYNENAQPDTYVDKGGELRSDSYNDGNWCGASYSNSITSAQIDFGPYGIKNTPFKSNKFILNNHTGIIKDNFIFAAEFDEAGEDLGDYVRSIKFSGEYNSTNKVCNISNFNSDAGLEYDFDMKQNSLVLCLGDNSHYPIGIDITNLTVN